MKILFQGDSVTDAGRDRSNPHDMGEGYPKYASAMLEDAFPNVEFEFINLGIGGNRTENLVERLESDFIEIQPDIVSIMIGVNDAWHYLAGIETTDEQFEENYTKVLTAIKERTNAKIMMISAYVLDDCYPNMAVIRQYLDGKLEITKKLAERFADVYFDMDAYFRHVTDVEEKTGFSADGVHPSPDGACIIGEKYLETIAPIVTELSKTED